MNVKPCIYTDFIGFRTTPEVKNLFLKAQKADKKRLNAALLKVCKFILDNPAKDNDISDNVKEEQEKVVEEKEVKSSIVATTITINKKSAKKSAKEPTKEELDELVRDVQDDKESAAVSLREKRNLAKSFSSKHPVAFQNREEYFRYLNNVVRPKYNTTIPAEKELYLAEKAEVDKILIIDENSEND